MADATGAVAAEACVFASCVQLVFVLHTARGRLEQGLPVDLKFELSDGRRSGYGLFEVVVLVDATQDPCGDGGECAGSDDRAQYDDQELVHVIIPIPLRCRSNEGDTTTLTFALVGYS